MTDFDNPDWNLAQAAAWVVYREVKLVNQLAAPGPHDFGTIGMYETMWPRHRQHHGSISELTGSLRNGSIEASGYHCDSPDTLQSIPKEVWADLHLSPPFAYLIHSHNPKSEPWKSIRVASSAVRRRWRSLSETSGRSKFDWTVVRALYEEAMKLNPDFTQNQLIDETQRVYSEKFNKDAPSKTSFHRNLKKWTQLVHQ